MLRPIRLLILAAGLLVALSACHGGGGDGSAAPSAPSPSPIVTRPAITTQPSNQTAAVGGAATFIVEVTGSAPLSYQWLKGGVPIAGATSATYTTPVVALADDGVAPVPRARLGVEPDAGRPVDLPVPESGHHGLDVGVRAPDRVFVDRCADGRVDQVADRADQRLV